MATNRCNFCKAETQGDQVTGLILKSNETFCKSCDRVVRFGVYILGFWAASALPIFYFQVFTPGSTASFIWVVVGLSPFFMVPTYLLVARFRNVSRQDVEESGCMIGAFSFIGVACVLVYQCFLWLVHGEWVPISAQGIFEFTLGPDHAFLQWLNNPQSWYGLHRIVDFLTGSLAVFLLVLGFAIFWISDSARSWFKLKTPD